MSLRNRDDSRQTHQGPAGFADWRELCRSPLIRLAFFWILGSIAAHQLGHILLFTTLGLVATSLTIAMLLAKRTRGVSTWLLIAVFALSGAWTLTFTDHIAPTSVLRFVDSKPQLARVRGIVDSPAVIAPAQRGHFAKFSYELPQTFAMLEVSEISVGDTWQPAAGVLMMKIQQIEDRLAHGDEIEAVGWLAGFDGPQNPGERDYQQAMKYREIDGRLALRRRGNWERLQPGSEHALQTIRINIADQAADVLRMGMQDHREALSLLNLLLLGRRGDVGDLHDRFRDVGLAHILAISGAHLAILLGMVWLIARMATPSPPRAALMVLVVLGLYLMMVPLKTPIVRASIMAGVFCIGQMSGRVVRGMDMLALSAVIILIWRPFDLFSPGFQLSFIVVGALILFAGRVERLPFERGDDDQVQSLDPPTRGQLLLHWVWTYTAVSLVAFFAALPLVAYHFEIITPFAVLLSVLALPLVTVILGLGYIKILAGFLWPSVSLVLSGLLAWFADALIMLVDHARAWPGSTLRLSQPPSGWWVFAVLVVMFAVGTGVFRGRRVAFGAAVLVLGLWVMWPGAMGMVRQPDEGLPGDWTVRVDAIAVGNGSCYLVRAGDFAMLFDAGSRDYLDVGERSIVPALKRLGVHDLNMLMLSHADLDHFSGSLAVAEAVDVERAAMSPQMMRKAAEEPRGSTAFLVEQLAELGVPVETVSRGWRREVRVAGDGGTEVVVFELVWPAADWEAKWDNDMSLVLSIEAAGRRVLLNGDVQQEAMLAMFEQGLPRSADVTDLPHHGAFVAASTDWLDRVGPSVVLQSCGYDRLYIDAWQDVFAERPEITRLITARHGLLSVTITADGSVNWRTFRQDAYGDGSAAGDAASPDLTSPSE